MIRKALSLAKVTGPSLGLVECHGTGTALGDPIETGALKATLAQGRTTPLLLATVKTNIGHLEGAAGVAGLLKSLLALQHRSSTVGLEAASFEDKCRPTCISRS